MNPREVDERLRDWALILEQAANGVPEAQDSMDRATGWMATILEAGPEPDPEPTDLELRLRAVRANAEIRTTLHSMWSKWEGEVVDLAPLTTLFADAA